jgi:hypothetical protein
MMAMAVNNPGRLIRNSSCQQVKVIKKMYLSRNSFEPRNVPKLSEFDHVKARASKDALRRSFPQKRAGLHRNNPGQ